MMTLDSHIKNYLLFCKSQKCLDSKTLKAYRIDLMQFSDSLNDIFIDGASLEALENFISFLHETYKPKTAKRKIATIKAFFHYLEYKDLITTNPFNKLHIKFREPVTLPKIIPLLTVETLLKTIYNYYNSAQTAYCRKKVLQDIAIIELLFSTGMRISELCSLKQNNVDLVTNTIRIYGKGSKERQIQIGNTDVINILKKYQTENSTSIQKQGNFFAKTNGEPVSDQSIRRMLKKYSSLAGIDVHITPHMFRHTFATSLLEADVDIRYIQEILGHSSISITEIYTHVTTAKQLDIMRNKHPRKNFNI